MGANQLFKSFDVTNFHIVQEINGILASMRIKCIKKRANKSLSVLSLCQPVEKVQNNKRN
jgi:hypothetical protein